MKNILIPEFPHAQWLRLPAYDCDDRDRRLQLRKSFELSELPESAFINVTADARYILYVNGEFVNYGPARGYQSRWPYDRLNIAPYLKKGKNVIAAMLYTFGIGTVMYVYGGDNGFLLSGKIGEVDISTNGSWLMRRAPGYAHAVAKCSRQYAYQEFADLRLADDDWFMADYVEDESWYIDKCASHVRSAGCSPWHSFESRNIPLLTRNVVPAAKVIAVSKQPAAENDLTEERHIFTHYAAEKFQWQAVDSAGNKVEFSGGVTGCVVDFGEELVAKLIFDIDGAADGDTLGFIAFEALEKDGFAPDFPPVKPYPSTCHGGRLILHQGKNRHELTLPWGLRYVLLWKHGGEFSLDLSARNCICDVDVQGSFSASDPMLQEIWQMSYRAQRCCMVDSYIDCPHRENSQWWGDALVQTRNTYQLTADASMLARGLRAISVQRLPNGLVHAVAPTAGNLCVLPDYALMFPVTLYAHYFQTGSTAMFSELADCCDGIFNYFAEQAALTGRGLAGYDERYWLFFDWCPGLFREGIPTLLNLQWLWALQKAGQLAEISGDAVRKEKYRQMVENLSSAIAEHLYDKEKRIICEGIGDDGEKVFQRTAHVASMAILTGLFPEDHQRWIDEILLPVVNGDRSCDYQPSTYFMYYVFEALKEYGYRQEIIDCISRWWGEMAEAGCSTTPEGFMDKVLAGHMSYCHAWSGHPLVHFAEILLGVKQLSAGWKKVSIEPLFIPGLEVSGKVPTPMGNIEVQISWVEGKAACQMRLPDGVEMM